MAARLTVVREDDDLDAIGRRLSGGDILIDGFVVTALVQAGVSSATLREAILSHAGRSDRRAPVALPYPEDWALHGELVSGRFEADRLEMGDVIWFGRGRSGTPHVSLRRSFAGLADDEILDSPLALLTGLPGASPIIRSVERNPQGWLYVDVDPVPASI